MAEEQKPTEVPQEAAPVAEPIAAEPVTEAPKTEETPAVAPAAESSEAPKAAEEGPAAEEPAKEVKPVEDGHLDFKTSNFPKNLLYSKKYFWFGSDPVDHKKLSQYVKAEKDAAHHILSWASETGKGLLFYAEHKDKASPQGVIQLSDASEPATEGSNKFHFSLRGNKYTFKAPSAADRDSWVSSIKAKIAEAKELATSVTEGETYKKTQEGLKPKPVAAPVKKEEKKEDKPAVEAAAAGAAAGAATTEVAAAETPAAPAPAAEAKKDTKLEDSKRRSSSRKRASIFGGLFGKKEGEEKKADAVPEASAAEPAAPAEAAAAEAPAAAAEETPAVPAEEPVSTEAPAAVAAESKAEEAKPEAKEAAKPAPSKRNSVFGNFSFGKKKPAAPEAEAAPTTPAKDTPAEAAVASDAAPVIPAVETTEPLSAEVSSPANVPVETVDVKPATNGDTKKEVKSEKRKASLPFNFGKKEKSPASDDDSEKPKSSSPFSKLRQTIKGKGKTAEKPSEKSEKVEPEAEAAEASNTAEPAAAEEAPKTEAAAPVPAEETPAEQPIATSTPTVAATA